MYCCSIMCVYLGYSWCFDSFFFFFKQKTAYEMRISDWSSDVCSSDLAVYTQRDGIDAGMMRMVGCRVGYPVCIEVEAVDANIFIDHVRIVGGDLHHRALYKTDVCYHRLICAQIGRAHV